MQIFLLCVANAMLAGYLAVKLGALFIAFLHYLLGLLQEYVLIYAVCGSVNMKVSYLQIREEVLQTQKKLTAVLEENQVLQAVLKKALRLLLQ